MLLREQMTDRVFQNVRICATDVDRGCGPQIAAAIYAKHEIERIPRAIRQRYFQPIGAPGYLQVVDEIRERVSFAWHDLLSFEPPRSDFSLIACKNVLADFDQSDRCQAFRMFHRALLPGGFLATEHTQEMPEGVEPLFEPISRYAQVYRRLDAASGLCATRRLPARDRDSQSRKIAEGADVVSKNGGCCEQEVSSCQLKNLPNGR